MSSNKGKKIKNIDNKDPNNLFNENEEENEEENSNENKEENSNENEDFEDEEEQKLNKSQSNDSSSIINLDEEAPIDKLNIDMSEVKIRIQSLLSILSNLKKKKEPNKSRNDYITELKNLSMQYYDYNTDICDLIFNLFAPNEAIDFMELDHLLLRPNETWSQGLSQGELQRIALIRVLIHQPEFVILDEATSAIPQKLEIEFIKRIK